MFCLIDINGLFVEVGNYTEYGIQDINLRDCGIKFKPTEIQLNFVEKCFANKYENKTVLDTEGLIKVSKQIISRIYSGENADYCESPWTVYLNNPNTDCNGVLITFEWVLTTGRCFKSVILYLINDYN